MLKTETSSEFYWAIEGKCQPQKTTQYTHRYTHLHKVVLVWDWRNLCNFEFDEYPFNPFKCAWKLKQQPPTMRCVNKGKQRAGGRRWVKMGARTHKVKSRRKLQREGRQAGASKCCAIINERINYEINGESRVSWP